MGTRASSATLLALGGSALAIALALAPGVEAAGEKVRTLELTADTREDGAFGIRIENLLVAVAVAPATEDARRFLAFETLTAVPIDLALVEASLLGADEIAWLDRYQAFVREAILPLLQGQEADWLIGATRPLAP